MSRITQADLEKYLFACADIALGELFNEQNVRSIRPGDGCSPKYLPLLIGKSSKRAYKRGEPIIWE